MGTKQAPCPTHRRTHANPALLMLPNPSCAILFIYHISIDLQYRANRNEPVCSTKKLNVAVSYTKQLMGNSTSEQVSQGIQDY